MIVAQKPLFGIDARIFSKILLMPNNVYLALNTK